MGVYPIYQVRHLIQGIKITEVYAVKSQTMANASLRTDYYGCVSLYRTFINQSKKVSPPDMNISGVESYNHKGVGQKKCKGVSGVAVEDV